MANPATSPPLTRASVLAAHAIVRPHVHRTPVLTNATLNLMASTPRGPEDVMEWWRSRDGSETEPVAEEGGEEPPAPAPARPVLRLYFKCENLQRIGAFKARGAFHALTRLVQQEGWEAKDAPGRERGVVTHSSGNHAQALALAARSFDLPCTIVMPSISPAAKIAATRGYGARVVFSGSTAPEREAVVADVVAETGAVLVPPYDHPDIVLGQGTLGLELQEQAAEIMGGGAGKEGAAGGDEWAGFFRAEETKPTVLPPGSGRDKGRALTAILAPCGGGGMLSGVAVSCEGTGTRVFGCEPSFQGGDDAGRGYRAGRRVEAVSTLSIADGLRTPLGEVPWGVIYGRRLVGGFYSVTETQIRKALRLVLERMKLVVEPSAAVPLAVALYNEEFRSMVEREGGEEGWDVGIVFSGGNVGMDALGALLEGVVV